LSDILQPESKHKLLWLYMTLHRWRLSKTLIDKQIV